MAYITCRNLVLGYEGRAVTRPLDFQVQQGDYLCVVGENGAGKSTLLKTLLGLVRPLEGEISIGDGLRANEIGYLSQQTPVQRDFPASVWEIVLSGTLPRCGRKPFFGRQEKLTAKEQMERMDVWELRKTCYRNLSGGQQQRVLLARALCATERLLLLDEPVAGLDPKVTAEFYQLIRELNQSGLTVMMVSHDLEAAVRDAGKILHIGREETFFGSKEDYLESTAWRQLEKGEVKAHE